MLKRFASKTSLNRYQVSNQSFLKACGTKEDLSEKIRLFRQVVGEDLPENWQQYFKELLDNCNPLKQVGPHAVFKLSRNKALITLVAQDPVLRRLVLKAEDHHVIVFRTHLARFKSRMKELGYLL